MKRKILNTIIIFILAIMLFANFSSVQATSLVNQGASIADSFTAAQDFTNTEKSSIINYQNLYSVINFLYNIAMIVGIVIAIIVGIGLGIRIVYGSVDEKADAKHLIIPYLGGVAIIAFGFTIWKIILGLLYNSF